MRAKSSTHRAASSGDMAFPSASRVSRESSEFGESSFSPLSRENRACIPRQASRSVPKSVALFRVVRVISVRMWRSLSAVIHLDSKRTITKIAPWSSPNQRSQAPTDSLAIRLPLRRPEGRDCIRLRHSLTIKTMSRDKTSPFRRRVWSGRGKISGTGRWYFPGRGTSRRSCLPPPFLARTTCCRRGAQTAFRGLRTSTS